MVVDLDREMGKAVALAQSGKLKQAIAIMDKLLAKTPGAFAVRYNLALMLLQAGRLKEALVHLDRILASHPNHQPSQFTKAKALLALDRAADALLLLERLPNRSDPETLIALGNAYRHLGRVEDASVAFQRLTEIAPGFVGGHLNLGQLQSSRSPELGLPVLERAVGLHPRNAELHGLLGHCLLRLGRHEQAIDVLRNALSLDPSLTVSRGHLLRACREVADWEEEERLFCSLRDDLPRLAEHLGPLALATQDAIFYPFTGVEIRAVASAEARFRVRGIPAPIARPRTAISPPLIIGYLSPDYRDHATMHLAGDIFGHHDRTRVKVIGYSVGPDDDSGWRQRVAEQCDRFVDLSPLPDRGAAELIAADNVHILVDMSVYTRHARPGIAALRPAPVQISWLGLAATSGAPWIDYILVDGVLVPIEHHKHFSERIIALPECYQPNLSWSVPDSPPPRSDLGLPADGIVFCSFNGHRKLDRASFRLWMEILSAVPGSVLWQLTPPDTAKLRLADAAGAAGVEPERLVWAPRLSRQEHLRRIPAANLFLDAIVCGAHTTAADALRMGVPLVTVAGERLGSRVAASLLTTAGFPELIAANPAEMRDLAIGLGNDRDQLGDLRRRLWNSLPTSPLFDPPRFARKLEAAYEAVWHRHASGKSPSDITMAVG